MDKKTTMKLRTCQKCKQDFETDAKGIKAHAALCKEVK